MDPEERARKEQERVMKDRERLKFRAYAASREVALASELFRSHFQLHEPEITVNVYARYVDVNVGLNDAQLRLLPARGRSRELHRFAEELRAGLEKVAAGLALEFTVDPSRFGGSGPIDLEDAPIGYRAVFRRPVPE
jgi:hypothetical protein